MPFGNGPLACLKGLVSCPQPEAQRSQGITDRHPETLPSAGPVDPSHPRNRILSLMAKHSAWLMH
jgi:hypothetical protein